MAHINENYRGYILLPQGTRKQGSAEILGTPSSSSHPRKWKPQQACLVGAGAKEEMQLLPEMLPKVEKEKTRCGSPLFLASNGPSGTCHWLTPDSGKHSLRRPAGSRRREGVHMRANRLTTSTRNSKSTTESGGPAELWRSSESCQPML